jgi:hypothetical protein
LLLRLIDGLAFLDCLEDLVVVHREYTVMKAAQNLIAAALVCALVCTTVHAQQPSAAPTSPAAVASRPQEAFGVLLGRWVRPDGGYVITIKTIDASGKLDASYANPSPLPFYTAEATSEGDALKLFFELRAGGYNGSTYTLKYDAASDQLKGVYYQAVAKQKFEIVFIRTK